MTNLPDAELLKLGRDLELLFQADAILSKGEDYDVRIAVSRRTTQTMKAIHRLQPSTIEGVAVKLRALCFDFADFERENMDLRKGDVAEVELGRLMRHVHKLVKVAT